MDVWSVEPPSDTRAWAKSQHEMYVSLVQAGFTEDQAMAYLTSMYAYLVLLFSKDGNNGEAT